MVHELADQLEQAADLHTAQAPYLVVCEACTVKRRTAALLRAIATLRELTGQIVKFDG